MEDHFDKLLYLIVGIVYLFLNKAKNRDDEKRAMPSQPSEHQPASTASVDGPSTWKDGNSKRPGRQPLFKTSIEKMPPRPVRNAAAQRATQQLPSKKTGRVLRRYSGWRGAMIMSELIQPYS